MKITAATRVSRQSPPTKLESAAPTATSTGWAPKKSTADERRMLGRTIDDAITLPAGASFLVRAGQARAAAAGTVGSEARRVIEEKLTARLPARSPEERERILSLATTLGAKTPALTHALLKDAISSGDAQLALVLVDDGAKLTKSDRLKLAPHILGDEVLSSADHTKNLARAAVSVLADNPAALQRFARSLSTPALLFTEVLSNKDTTLAPSLKPLVGLLSPKEADGLARRNTNILELQTDLQARAKQK